MSDQLLRDFAAHAEQQVVVPDLGTLRRRGRRRVVRRTALGALVAVVALVVAGGLDGRLGRQDAAPDPARPEPDLVDAVPWPGGPGNPPLAAGTYRITLSPYPDVPTATVTVPAGWQGWLGPVRDDRTPRFASVLVLDVDEVVAEPCQHGGSGMRAVQDEPGAVVAALLQVPRHRVRVVDRAHPRFSYPATHLTMTSERSARCPFDQPFELVNTAQGLVSTFAGNRIDLWVVDVDGRAVVVAATHAPGTRPRVLAQLTAILDSVSLTPPAR